MNKDIVFNFIKRIWVRDQKNLFFKVNLSFSRTYIEDITTTYDDLGMKCERDAFDALFDHAPDKLQVVKKVIEIFVYSLVNLHCHIAILLIPSELNREQVFVYKCNTIWSRSLMLKQHFLCFPI